MQWGYGNASQHYLTAIPSSRQLQLNTQQCPNCDNTKKMHPKHQHLVCPIPLTATKQRINNHHVTMQLTHLAQPKHQHHVVKYHRFAWSWKDHALRKWESNWCRFPQPSCLTARRQWQPKKLAAYKLRQCSPCGHPSVNTSLSNTTRLNQGWEKQTRN